MLALGKEPVLTHYVRSLRGCSKPILARASDGELYVVKFANASLGGNLLFNESMGTEIYKACKLPVPEWTPLRLTESFLEDTPELSHLRNEPAFRSASGLCFGSKFCAEEGAEFLEVLPGSSFTRVNNLGDFWLAWLVDICAGHTDNRQVIFRQDESGRLKAIFLDHGHMFGGPKGERSPSLQAPRYLDGRVYPPVPSGLKRKLMKTVASSDLSRLWLRVHELPEEWKTDSALSNFAGFIEKFSDKRFLGTLLDEMAESLIGGYRIHDAVGTRPAVGAVLYPRVQVA